MEHYRLRKYRGVETWARVREAYVAGESAASVARRFDVSVFNLRKKASREGWTRNRIAEALDRELVGVRRTPARCDVPEVMSADPRAAVASAVGRAAAALDRGEAGEAVGLLRAAETLDRLASGGGGGGGGRSRSARGDDWDREAIAESEELQLNVREKVNGWVQEAAADLASRLLSDQAEPHDFHSGFIYHWRARHLPESAAGDRARLQAKGLADRYWAEDGTLKPLEEIVAERHTSDLAEIRRAYGLPPK